MFMRRRLELPLVLVIVSSQLNSREAAANPSDIIVPYTIVMMRTLTTRQMSIRSTQELPSLTHLAPLTIRPPMIDRKVGLRLQYAAGLDLRCLHRMTLKSGNNYTQRDYNLLVRLNSKTKSTPSKSNHLPRNMYRRPRKLNQKWCSLK